MLQACADGDMYEAHLERGGGGTWHSTEKVHFCNDMAKAMMAAGHSLMDLDCCGEKAPGMEGRRHLDAEVGEV
jgi:hypothetical protein